jgi:hypothetical protein
MRITKPRSRVLLLLALSGGEILAPKGDGRKQLADVLAADSVARVLSDLESEGFIELEERRGRVYSIKITAPGSEVVSDTQGSLDHLHDLAGVRFDKSVARLVVSATAARTLAYIDSIDEETSANEARLGMIMSMSHPTTPRPLESAELMKKLALCRRAFDQLADAVALGDDEAVPLTRQALGSITELSSCLVGSLRFEETQEATMTGGADSVI